MIMRVAISRKVLIQEMRIRMLLNIKTNKRLANIAFLSALITGIHGCASQPVDKVPDLTTNKPNNAPILASGVQAKSNASIIQPYKQDQGVLPQKPKNRGYILGGTGGFINPLTPDIKSDDNLNSKTVTLNFSDVPMDEALNAILGDILGRRYIIEEGVAGEMTLQSSRPIELESLLPILESVLKSKGAAIVEEGEYLRIVPLSSASRQGRLSNGQSLPGFGVHVEPLRYVAAAEMARILEPIAPEGAILRVDRSRNLLLLSGTQNEIQALTNTIGIFDVDWLEGMSFGVYPVQSSSPEDIIRDLEDVFSSQAESPIEGLVRFLPNNRLNAVIAVTPTPNILRHVESWVEKFDDVDKQSSEQLFVYDVQNGTAAELAQVLQSVLGGQSTSRQLPQTVAPDLNPRSVASDSLGDRAESDITRSVSRANNSQNVSGFEIGNGSPLVSGDSISIFPYDSKNSLVIVATPADYQGLLSILDKLDVVSNQVLIEATIAEVTLQDELSLGLQWFFRNGNVDINLSNTGTVGPIFPGFSAVISQVEAQVALNALESITDVKVISSPSLMVLDNQTAVLQVGDEVPIVTQQSVTNSLTTPIFNSVTFRDTGVILRVTPRVNDSGLVLLEIEQEVSNVVGTITSGIDSPTIQQRRIETTVAVNDGESLALGGLIEDSVSRTSSGVPFISRVPVLGNLFKTEADDDDRTELLIIITPRVIRNMDEARKVTDEYRQRLNSLLSFEERLDGPR